MALLSSIYHSTDHLLALASEAEKVNFHRSLEGTCLFIHVLSFVTHPATNVQNEENHCKLFHSELDAMKRCKSRSMPDVVLYFLH